MRLESISWTVHRNRAQSKLCTSSKYADGDLPTVGRQDFLERKLPNILCLRILC